MLAAGCGGEERLPVLRLDAEPVGSPARGPGLVVLAFVQAARAGDTKAMRALMSAETRASYAPGVAGELADDFEGFSGPRVELSLRLDGGWAVAAVSGRSRDDEPAAYAAALRLEAGRWRLELGGIAFGLLKPAPLAEVGERPELRVEAQAGTEIDELALWIGDRPVLSHPIRRRSFTREVWGRLDRPLDPGPQIAVAFAVAGETAGAFAWPFEVEG
ncbi:MAG: hypothetical protein WD689_11330 [Gaiellaceae bacterium]